MAKIKWVKTSMPGIRYREHPTRKHGIRPDRYYTIRYKLHGKDKEEGVGWESEGWTQERAQIELSRLKIAQDTGEGPSTRAEKKALAKAKYEAEQAENERKAREAFTFEQVFRESYFPLAKTKNKWTVAREDSLFRLWIHPVIGNLPLKDISPFHLEKLKKNMADAGKAPRSIHYALAVIRQVFNFARNHSMYTGENPVSKVKKPAGDNKRIRFLTHGEADLLLNALANKSQEVYEMALLSLHCGLRAGEVFALTWGDLNLDQGTLTLRDTKNKRSRVAFMTNLVKETLMNKTKGGPSDLVFQARGGKKVQAISRTFDRTVRELGLNRGITDPRQRVVFHTLRYTYASWLADRGVDLYVIEKLMGHSNIAMTERYSHLGENSFRRAVKQFEESLIETRKGEVIELKG